MNHKCNELLTHEDAASIATSWTDEELEMAREELAVTMNHVVELGRLIGAAEEAMGIVVQPTTGNTRKSKRDLWREADITKWNLARAHELQPKGCIFKFWFNEWMRKKLQEDLKKTAM